MANRISKNAPKVTLKQLAEAKCEVRAKKGMFRIDAYKPNNTHDGAWDKMAKQYPTFQRALSFISSTFWTWNTAADASPFRYPLAWKKAFKIICLRDKTLGAKNTCWSGKETPGQLKAVEDVAKSKDPTVLKYMVAYFSMANGDPKTLFSNLELLIARNNSDLLNELKTTFANENNAMKLEKMVSDMQERGVSVNATAQLAAAAFNKVDQLVKSGTDCKSAVVQELYASGNLWLKITRRLAHGMNAVSFQQSKGKEPDPLFDKRSTSELTCKVDSTLGAAIAKAISYFNVQGSLGAHLSGVSLAFLSGAMAAADEAMAKCGKQQPVKTKTCTGGKELVDGKCKCPPSKPKWSRILKRCYKPREYHRCTGDRVRINGRCKCKSGFKWTGSRCKKEQKGMFRTMEYN